MSTTEKLQQAVATFVKSAREFEFPAGGRIELLTALEHELLTVLSECGLSIEEKINVLRGDFHWSDCYSLLIIADRLAILGARTMNVSTYSIGILILAAGSPKVDWRDVLGAFAIFEACGSILGVDFESELKAVVQCVESAEFSSTIDGFFDREDKLREVGAMGIVQIGEGASLTFRARCMIELRGNGLEN